MNDWMEDLGRKAAYAAVLAVSFSLVLVTGAFAAASCPGPSCSCKTVKSHVCDARSDGSLYNCRDVNETQCTITSGPGSVKASQGNSGGSPPKHPVRPPIRSGNGRPSRR